MENMNSIQEMIVPFLPFIIFFVLWEVIWKLLAMWRAAQNKQPGWFICLALINTMGILPILYLLLVKNKNTH